MHEIVTKEDLRLSQELQTLQMTVRLGGIVAAGFAALAVLIKLT
jgi:hypothetical protein